MLECQKRQVVVKNGTTTHRCINKDCEANGQNVVEDVCSVCPLRVTAKKLPVCREKTPKPVLRHIPHSFDVTEAETPDGEGAKEYPPLSMQLFNYKQALLKWNEAGRPKRTDEEVAHILEICKTCDWYDKDHSRCRGCGCRVTEGGIAILNKLRMATEECPKGLWK